jgi:hypothetical protein
MQDAPRYSIRELAALWPDLSAGNAQVNAPNNSFDRFTGKLISGWPAVQQRMDILFSTPIHQRVLRRWVGSLVPRMLGQNIVSATILRFFNAIATALDLWEPCYRVGRVYFMENVGPPEAPPIPLAAASAEIRAGNIAFRTEGVYYPYAVQGNFTPQTMPVQQILIPSVVNASDQIVTESLHIKKRFIRKIARKAR